MKNQREYLKMAPRAGVREVYQFKALGCQTDAHSNFEPERFPGVVSNPPA